VVRSLELVNLCNGCSSSQVAVQNMLQKFMDEVRTGKREGSVVSTHSVDSLLYEEKLAWRELRKELEDVGITPQLFEKHKQLISKTLRDAIESELCVRELEDITAQVLNQDEDLRDAIESELCVSELEDITAQVLNQDEEVRFRCLAFKKGGDYRYRCLQSSKEFGADHPLLYGHAKTVLDSKSLVIPVTEFRLVIRGLFCQEHLKSEPFRRLFKSIEPNWIADGNVKERELLNAIRYRHNPKA
jgi:hypothetical protein